MDCLEFLSKEPPFFELFIILNTGNNGIIRIGKMGKEMRPFYLLDRWIIGKTDSGLL
jgi:hypothetical protein